METTIKEQDGKLFAFFNGRLDTSSASQVEKDIKPLTDCTGHDIVLDCTDMSYISSSGLRIFLGVLKNAKGKGSKVFVKGLTPDVEKIFQMTGFINLFERFEKKEEEQED